MTETPTLPQQRAECSVPGCELLSTPGHTASSSGVHKALVRQKNHNVDFFRFSQTGLDKQAAVICTAFLAAAICTAFLAAACSVSSETLPR